MSGRFAKNRGTVNTPRANSSTVCQKCLGTGHFIYDCKNPRPYVSRPSRTKQLEDPKYRTPRDKPSVELPDEFKAGPKKPVVVAGTADAILAKKDKERAEKSKSKRRSSSSSSDSDSSSGSDSDSGSSSSGSSSSGSSSRSNSRSRSPSQTPPRRGGRHDHAESPVRRSASPPRRAPRDYSD